MKILKEDNTVQIIPSGHQQDDDVTWSLYQYNKYISNMSDDFPLNYVMLGNRFLSTSNWVEIQTINSDTIGVAGANANTITAHICDGTIHDSADLISNGIFEDWDSDGTPTDWDVESNVNITEISESTTIIFGGYSYDQAARLDQPSAGTNMAIKQTITVDASTYYKLSIINKHYIGRLNRYSIYDESNGAYIGGSSKIISAFESTSGASEAVTTSNIAFSTPVGCTSITISIWVPDTVDYYIEIYGVSLRPIVESFGTLTVSTDRLYDGVPFNTYVQEYTKIVGEHSVLLQITETQSSPIGPKIGCIQTGLIVEYNDPKEYMSQGLIMDSPYVDLKYGGRLIVDKYNLDVFDIELIFGAAAGSGALLLEGGDFLLLEGGDQLLLESGSDAATEFMFETFPDIRLAPRFMIIGSLDTQDWSVFARFEKSPVMIDYLKYQRITFRLIEAI